MSGINTIRKVTRGSLGVVDVEPVSRGEPDFKRGPGGKVDVK